MNVTTVPNTSRAYELAFWRGYGARVGNAVPAAGSAAVLARHAAVSRATRPVPIPSFEPNPH